MSETLHLVNCEFILAFMHFKSVFLREIRKYIIIKFLYKNFKLRSEIDALRFN